MDLGFSRSGRTRGLAQPVGLDHRRLVASIAAMQAATLTARTEALLGKVRRSSASPVEALVAVFEHRAGWIAAAASLGGSFHPELARRSVPKPA